MITAASAMVKCLMEQGVKTVFGYPGAAICPFYDALYSTDIHHVLVRQEQNAAHAASGYARMTGKPGVCIATSGPGALNLITGIATAYMDSVPMIAITGQVDSELLGRDVFQEADMTGSAEPFVKHSYLVKNPKDLPRIFREAFYIAGSGRPGPVLIDVPVDVQKAMIPFEEQEGDIVIAGYKPSFKGHPMQIRRACESLVKAERPVIVAGGGIFYADAQKCLRELAESLNIPVIHTMMGKGVLPAGHPLEVGMLGMHGTAWANRIVNHADTILIVGARVGDRSVKNPGKISEKATTIHIDVDPAEIGKNVAIDIPIVGDAAQILSQMLAFFAEKVPAPHMGWWQEYMPSSLPVRAKFGADGCINPKWFLHQLSEKAGKNAYCVADVGQNQIWSCINFDVHEGRYITSGGMGTMGYALPAAVGVALAQRDMGLDAPVFAVCGDGSFQMSMMELATVVNQKLPVKVVLFVNERLGMVRELQDKLYERREIAVFLDGSPAFDKLAAAYGIRSRVLTADEPDIDGVMDEFLRSEDAYFLEVVVSPNESTL